jgi:hypothetical protein
MAGLDPAIHPSACTDGCMDGVRTLTLLTKGGHDVRGGLMVRHLLIVMLAGNDSELVALLRRC